MTVALTDTNLRQFDESASTDAPEGAGSTVSAAWEILGYELVKGEGWASEEAVLSRDDVQEALAEGLRELRELREQRNQT